jgi:hypothetical protein
LYYLAEPHAISRYVRSVWYKWGYQSKFNFSHKSEAIYHTVQLGRDENNKLVSRFANHHPSNKEDITFDYDIYTSFYRQEAISYLKYLQLMAKKYNLILPEEFSYLTQPRPYHQYLQKMHIRRHRITNSYAYYYVHLKEKIFVD